MKDRPLLIVLTVLLSLAFIALLIMLGTSLPAFLNCK